MTDAVQPAPADAAPKPPKKGVLGLIVGLVGALAARRRKLLRHLVAG